MDSTIYVSSPSSIKCAGGVYPVLCRYSGTTNLPQGRVVSYFRATASGTQRFCFYFRNQADVGIADRSNTYEFFGTFYATTSPWYLYEYIGGTQYTLYFGSSYLTGNFSLDTWHRIRITWWLSGSVPMIRVERYANGWDKIVADMSDSTPTGGATVNRFGIGALAASAYGVWFDDTEIWWP